MRPRRCRSMLNFTLFLEGQLRVFFYYYRIEVPYYQRVLLVQISNLLTRNTLSICASSRFSCYVETLLKGFANSIQKIANTHGDNLRSMCFCIGELLKFLLSHNTIKYLYARFNCLFEIYCLVNVIFNSIYTKSRNWKPIYLSQYCKVKELTVITIRMNSRSFYKMRSADFL